MTRAAFPGGRSRPAGLSDARRPGSRGPPLGRGADSCRRARRGLRGSANRSFPTCAVESLSPRVEPPQPSASPAQSFRKTNSSVSASWTQPTATCSRGDQYAAFWIGIDGYSSSTVEQTGTEADCVGNTAEYYAWYERAARTVSRTSLDLPIPASPVRNTVPPRPLPAAARAARSWRLSSSRPTSTGHSTCCT